MFLSIIIYFLFHLKGWLLDETVNGQYVFFPNGGVTPEIMLFTDMSLAFDIGSDPQSSISPHPRRCGPNSDCQSSPASVRSRVDQYATNSTLFLSDFVRSFEKMVNVEYSYEDKRTGQSFVGRLGTLTYFDPNTCSLPPNLPPFI